MNDRFLPLAEIATQLGKSVAHLRKIGEAQHGMFKRRPFSYAALDSYPRFTKGPGGRWGIFESQLVAYWNSLRRKHSNVVDIATGRRNVR